MDVGSVVTDAAGEMGSVFEDGELERVVSDSEIRFEGRPTFP